MNTAIQALDTSTLAAATFTAGTLHSAVGDVAEMVREISRLQAVSTTVKGNIDRLVLHIP